MSTNAFAKNQGRLDRARDLLQLKNGFYRFRDSLEDALPDEATSYGETQGYREDMAHYFRYRLDYFPLFDAKAGLNPFKWVYYADLHDKVVEDYFGKDFDIRSNITAYRLATQWNQWRHIRSKRIIQAIASLTLYLSLIALPLLVMHMGEAPVGGLDPVGALVPLTLLLGAVIVVAAGAAHEWGLHYFSSRLRDTFEVNATNLSKKIQHRFANLVQNYTTFMRNLSEEEFNSSELDSREWIERCSWWAKMAMWNAKRVEYCEKFFQSEMQRLRVFINFTDPLGNFLAVATPALLLAIPIVLTLRYFDSALGAQAAAAQARTVAGLQLAGAWIAAMVSFLLAYRSTRPAHSILLNDIRKWITEREWKRFADIGLDEEIAKMVRRDKDRIRQEKMRGGFGTGHNRSGPM